jgi:nucleotide-binding universal stress UspA family protein
VSSADRTFEIRRILVALDASPHSLAALKAAAELAARLQADLLGLFVEDIVLLDLADSPYAREILYPAATQARLSRASMESELKALAEQARKALATTAGQSQVRWSFRIVRGEVTTEVLAAAGEFDLLAMGKIGWSLGSQARMGSTAREAARSAVPVLLLPEHALPPGARLLVRYDGSSAAELAVLAAAQLATSGAANLTVLLAAEDRRRADELKDEVERLVEGKNIQVRYRQIDPQDGAKLLAALKDEKAHVLVLGSRDLLRDPAVLEALLRETETALLLLGDGSESEE